MTPDSFLSHQADPQAATRSAGCRRLLLVTGMLGAGKTTALRELEDLGWEVFDNFPLDMVEQLLARPGPGHGGLGQPPMPLAIGLDARTRGFTPDAVIALGERLRARSDLSVSSLFLDCAGRELERRYNETRRRHPLAVAQPLAAGIAQEREMLGSLRKWADGVLVTTAFSSRHLQEAIREQFASDTGQGLNLTVSSFGFARGMPPVADLVFDMRFLDNPHWVPGLREQTGLDQPVADHIEADPAFAENFTRIRDLLLALLPNYARHGRSYLSIAFGCTGGRHRSVFTAEQIAKSLRDAGFSPTVVHRNLSSRAADMQEGPQQP